MQEDSILDEGVVTLYEKQALSTEPIKREDEVFTPINDTHFVSSGTFQNEERPILSRIKEEPHFYEDSDVQHMELQPSVSSMGEEPPPMELSIPKIHIECQVIEVDKDFTRDLIKDEPLRHEEECLANRDMSACKSDDLIKDEPPVTEMSIKEEPPSIEDISQPTGSVPCYTSAKATALLKDEADSSPQKTHPCPLCKQKFSTFAMLVNHRKLQNGMKISCSECGANFCNKRGLAAHAIRHRKSVSCWDCGAEFSSRTQLVEHFRASHNRNFESCLECGQDFTNRADLTAHVQEHKVKSNLISCSKCGADFLHKVHLEAHMRKCYTEMSKVFCKVCGEGFSSGVALRGHARRHKDEGKNFCKECGECFSCKLDLIVHLKEHKARQAGVHCKECGADLSNEMDLVAHTQKDTGESHCPFKKTYACPFCSRTFTHPGNLIRHREKAARASCPQCGANFCSNTDLVLHARVHKPVFCCTDCNLTFSTNHDLWIHRNVHMFTCGECGKLFMNQDELAEHVQDHGLLSCWRCGKRFADETNLQEHVKIHLPFPCAHCGMRFADPTDLVEHVKLHRPVRLLFSCAQCGKTFVNTSDFAEHMKVHTAAQVLVVTARSQLSAQREDSPNHQQTPKLFPCLDCDKTFLSLSHLIVHETFHTARKLPL